MAIIRGPDGKPIGDDDEGTEATTRRVERRSIKDRVSTKEESQTGPASGGGSEESETTDPVGVGAGAKAESNAGASAGTALSDDGSPATQIIGARKRSSAPKSEDKQAAPGSTEREEPMEDPVVGWVVVVEGPGQGASVTLGYGMNSIGRAPSERICLDFGDTQISRTNHASITYDPRGKKYFVAHGGGKNLTYLGEEPVLMPVQMKGGEEILVGDTKLRFVPFCGEDFDWRDK
ncbi:MAG: FHA domain-containing protein [Alphaproteobacteria bacterium]